MTEQQSQDSLGQTTQQGPAQKAAQTSEEKPEQQVVQCLICGHKMVIPPGYENVAARCSKCGEPISVGSPADIDPAASTFSAVPPPVLVDEEQGFWGALLRALPWAVGLGVFAAVVGGVLMAYFVIYVLKIGEMTLSGLIVCGDVGALMGLVFTASWVIIKKTHAGPVIGTAITVCASVPLGILTYLLEWAFISRPDMPLWGAAVIYLLGGAFVGFVLAFVIPIFED